ncbi:MAG TPA: response regulator [Geobacteraceae bacterium]|nr:response regulator [Geobacteraceae bacterium]
MKKKILVVDDEPNLTRMVRRGLEARGDYLVMEVNAGNRALAAARNFRPDLVLLDVMMPDVDGGSVASEFAEANDLKHVPIVFLTAIVTRAETQPTGSVIGKHTFLAKPVNLDDLITCIEDHLGK